MSPDGPNVSIASSTASDPPISDTVPRHRSNAKARPRPAHELAGCGDAAEQPCHATEGRHRGSSGQAQADTRLLDLDHRADEVPSSPTSHRRRVAIDLEVRTLNEGSSCAFSRWRPARHPGGGVGGDMREACDDGAAAAKSGPSHVHTWTGEEMEAKQADACRSEVPDGRLRFSIFVAAGTAEQRPCRSCSGRSRSPPVGPRLARCRRRRAGRPPPTLRARGVGVTWMLGTPSCWAYAMYSSVSRGPGYATRIGTSGLRQHDRSLGGQAAVDLDVGAGHKARAGTRQNAITSPTRPAGRPARSGASDPTLDESCRAITAEQVRGPAQHRRVDRAGNSVDGCSRGRGRPPWLGSAR
jgi:hypothetical protein